MSDLTASPDLPDEASAAPDGDSSHGHSHLGLALVVISAAQLMVVLDATIVNIALPFVKTDLGFSDSNLTWVVNGYTLAFGGLLLLGGRMGDIIGRRKVFMFGVTLFALASFVGGVSQNEGMMLTARVLQGIGAAAASPTALSLITTTFPSGPARNRAFGVYAAMSGAGAAVGLLLGGALTEADWRWTFFINVPIGLFVAFLAPRVLGESEPQPGKFDLPGAVTATIGLVGIVYGLTHKGQAGATWTEPQTLIPLLGGIVLVAVFLRIEAVSPHALMPLRILANRTRAVSFLVMLVVGAAMFSMFYFLGLYIQIDLGYSAIQAGLAFLPFSFGIVVAATIASTLMSRVDPRWISGVGAVLGTVGMLLFLNLPTDPHLDKLSKSGFTGKFPSGVFDAGYATHVLPSIVVMSLGMGLLFVPLTLTAVSGVAAEDSGVGSAVLNTMQQVGGALGLSVLGTIAANKATDHVPSLVQQLSGAGVSGSSAGPLAGALAQPTGYVLAFGVSAIMMAAMAVVILVGLNVSHEEVAADGASPVPMG